MTSDDAATRTRGAAPRLRRDSWWTRLWQPFWAIPAACAVGAVLAGVFLPQLDRALGAELPFVFPGGPDGARSVLGTIAGAMISVMGLVFSITMVVLQLASQQFTPRLLGTFLQSRLSQGTLGSFIASFVYALTVLREVRGEESGNAFVPQLSVTVAYLLVLASVGLFMAFINHITQSIQVSRVIGRIGDDTRRIVAALYPEAAPELGGPTWSPRPGTEHQVVPHTGRRGHIAGVDVDALVDLAHGAGGVIVLTRPVGSFLVEGQPLAQCWGAELDEQQVRRLRGAVDVQGEPTLRHDPAFGIRQLVDIAERALSPGVNDPTTAVQAINALHDILRTLVKREAPSPYFLDPDGVVRLVHAPLDVTALVRLAVEEIAHYGSNSIQVPRRLHTMLDDLETAALPQHRATLEQARALVDAETAA